MNIGRNRLGPYRENGLTLLEVVVVIAVVVMLALVLFPSYRIDHGSSRGIYCASNLKQVGLAFRIWEGDNGNLFPMQVYTNKVGEPLFMRATEQFRYFQVMSNELSNPEAVHCPANRETRPATNFTSDFDSSHISFFVGLEANDSQPHSFAAGDANITSSVPPLNGLWQITTNQTIGWSKKRHKGQGNILFSDGSVQQFTSAALQTALPHTGLVTNRLLMPQ